MQLLKPGLNIVLDGQWGSTGKGKLCGELGKRKPDYVCSSFGPNAGHTYVDGDGEETIFKALPTSAITSTAPVLILPDSVVNIDRLMKEIKMLPNKNEVWVHPLVAVVTDDDKKAAEETGKHIAGTMQGTGHAISKKLLRIAGNKLAKDLLPSSMLSDTSRMLQAACAKKATTIVEVSQGFDLSLNHGHEYPYLTSRDVTVGGALNACGCPPSCLGNVIGSLRYMPIRVGNIEGGNSGPCYADQEEITWSHVTDSSRSPDKIEEKTTVTKRVRRVFTFSMEQVKKFVRYNDPDWLFLNFVQYMDHSMEGTCAWDGLTKKMQRFIENVERATQSKVAMIGTGKAEDAMIDVI